MFEYQVSERRTLKICLNVEQGESKHTKIPISALQNTICGYTNCCWEKKQSQFQARKEKQKNQQTGTNWLAQIFPLRHMHSTSAWIPTFLIKWASTYSFAGGIFFWLTERKVNHINLPSHSTVKQQREGISLLPLLGCHSALLSADADTELSPQAPVTHFSPLILGGRGTFLVFVTAAVLVEVVDHLMDVWAVQQILSLQRDGAGMQIPAPLGRSSNCSYLTCIHD